MLIILYREKNSKTIFHCRSHRTSQLVRYRHNRIIGGIEWFLDCIF